MPCVLGHLLHNGLRQIIAQWVRLPTCSNPSLHSMCRASQNQPEVREGGVLTSTGQLPGELLVVGTIRGECEYPRPNLLPQQVVSSARITYRALQGFGQVHGRRVCGQALEAKHTVRPKDILPPHIRHRGRALAQVIHMLNLMGSLRLHHALGKRAQDHAHSNHQVIFPGIHGQVQMCGLPQQGRVL